MQQTVINQRLPILIPEIASRLNLPDDQIINIFEFFYTISKFFKIQNVN